MARAANDEFWNALHERWRGGDPEKERDVVASVLWHLANRLSGPEARHVEEQLPPDLKEIWQAPERNEHVWLERRVQRLDYDDLLGTVSEEADLPDSGETARAVRGVFHALGHLLGDEERRHLAAQLPPDIRKVWHEEAQ